MKNRRLNLLEFGQALGREEMRKLLAGSSHSGGSGGGGGGSCNCTNWLFCNSGPSIGYCSPHASSGTNPNTLCDMLGHPGGGSWGNSTMCCHICS